MGGGRLGGVVGRVGCARAAEGVDGGGTVACMQGVRTCGGVAAQGVVGIEGGVLMCSARSHHVWC